jgi:adenylosuccinate lyase
MMVLLRGYNTMASDLAGDQWNEGDVSCSVVRRVVIPDAFYVIDGLLHTFMTILKEFGAFEEEINAELNENLPLLATTKILMECVKSGMGREAAHELIKKHSTKSKDFFAGLAQENGFPFSMEQLQLFIKDPADFAGNAGKQSAEVQKLISDKVKGKISNVALSKLR